MRFVFQAAFVAGGVFALLYRLRFQKRGEPVPAFGHKRWHKAAIATVILAGGFLAFALASATASGGGLP